MPLAHLPSNENILQNQDVFLAFCFFKLLKRQRKTKEAKLANHTKVNPRHGEQSCIPFLQAD